MTQHNRFRARVGATAGLLGTAWAFALSSSLPAHAQGSAGKTWPGSDLGWQQCQRMTGDKDARLACFDRWAQEQQGGVPAAAAATRGTASTVPAATSASRVSTR